MSELDLSRLNLNESSGSSFYNTPCESPSAYYSDVESTSLPLNNPLSSYSNSVSVSLQAAFDTAVNQESALMMSSSTGLDSCRSTPSVGTTCTLRSASGLPVKSSQPSNSNGQDRKKSPTGSTELPLQIALDRLNDLSMQTYQLASFQKQLEGMSHRVETIQKDLSSKIEEIYEHVLNHINTHVTEKSTQTTMIPKSPGATLSTANQLNTGIATAADKSRLNRIQRTPLQKVAQTPTDNKPHTKDPLPTLQDDGFKRLPALVKGYLTRRLMKTEYVQELKRTIADTMIELEAFRTDDVLSPQDVLLHEQLMIQFNKSYMEFYNVFFKYSKPTQMQLIARSRELRRERVFSRASSRFSVNGNSTMSILQANSSVVKANKAKRRLTVTVASVPPKTESIPEPKRITRRMTDKAAAFIENKSPRPVRRLTRERPTTRKTALKATQVR